MDVIKTKKSLLEGGRLPKLKQGRFELKNRLFFLSIASLSYIEKIKPKCHAKEILYFQWLLLQSESELSFSMAIILWPFP